MQTSQQSTALNYKMIVEKRTVPSLEMLVHVPTRDTPIPHCVTKKLVTLIHTIVGYRNPQHYCDALLYRIKQCGDLYSLQKQCQLTAIFLRCIAFATLYMHKPCMHPYLFCLNYCGTLHLFKSFVVYNVSIMVNLCFT